jgi:hypothetical protein
MTVKREREPAPARSPEQALGEARRLRLQHDWALPMSERLARLHELCKQMTAVAGAANRQ